MSEYKGFSGVSEAVLRQMWSYLLTQESTGLAVDGVLTGLGVYQEATASANVLVDAGSGVSQDVRLNGAVPLLNTSTKTLDVLTANPMGGTPRNDLVVFDSATTNNTTGLGGIRVIVGTPNAVPTDPTVPATAVPLARLRHAAGATTVPTAKIDDLRVLTSLFGGATSTNLVNGVPFAGASTTKAAKRLHWGTFSGTTNASGQLTVTHGAGFTPTTCLLTFGADLSVQWAYNNLGATTFRIRALDSGGAVLDSFAISGSYLVGE